MIREDGNAELSTQPLHDLRCVQGIAAEVEEVVGPLNSVQPKHFAPDCSDSPRHGVRRPRIARPRAGRPTRHAERLQRPPVNLAVDADRKLVDCDYGRNCVAGELPGCVLAHGADVDPVRRG